MARNKRGQWVICSTCKGNGEHSAYLGVFTMDEFNEAFDEEDAERYFNGAYDRKCETCDGSGKVFQSEEPEDIENARFEREWANEQRWERRMLYGTEG